MRDAHEPTSNRLLLSGFMMLGVALLAVIVLVIFLVSQLGSQTQRVELAACQRENTKTRSDNNAHLGDYVVFSFVAARFLTPTHTETAAQKQITNEFAGKLHSAVTDSSWTPVTDCRRAVSEGVNYTSPVSVAFTTRLPPPPALPARGSG